MGETWLENNGRRTGGGKRKGSGIHPREVPSNMVAPISAHFKQSSDS